MLVVLLHALSAALVPPCGSVPRLLGAHHVPTPPLLACRRQPHASSSKTIGSLSSLRVGPRRCGAPVLSAANANAAEEAPATPLDASGGPVAPVRFSTPLVWFIGVLVSSLTVAACRLPLPRLQLVDLATSPYLPTRALLLMRTCFAVAVGTSLRSSLWDPQPVRLRFDLITYAGTRLAPRSANFQGLERLTTYTVQCWALQLLYFTLAAAASALHLAGGGVVAGGISLPTALCRAVHILYQLVMQVS